MKKGLNIKLRKYKEKDLDIHLKLFLMNGICLKINDRIKEQERKWLKKVIENYNKTHLSFFVLAITLNKKIIGNLIAEKINTKNKTLEVGFWIGKDYWNKGYATKALNLFLQKIQIKFNPNKIFAFHKKGNFASKKVLEKAGFNFESNKRGMEKYCYNSF